MVTKSCELCSAPARIYCEADRAILCWDCDNAVHAANFLVARHSRNLLCQSCCSITEWRASGSELGRLVSVCQRCDLGVEIGAKGEDYEEIDVRDNDDFGDTEDEADGLEEEEEVVSDDENRDNQVVPWSIAPPPRTSSSSSSEESTPESAILLSLKRKRGDSNDLSSPAPPQEDLCDNISSNYGYASAMAEDWSSGEDGAETEGQRTSVDSFRPLEKDMKRGGDSSVQPLSVAASFRRLVRREVAELGKGNGKGNVGSSGSLSAVGFKMK